MLVIREAQWRAIESSLHSAFETRAIAQLRASRAHHLHELDDDTLRICVHNGIRVAVDHGISDEAFVMALLELMVDFGWNFQSSTQTSWAMDILSRSELTEDEKIAELLRHRLSLMLEKRNALG
ncbi:hypothetical protein CCU68_11435 [Pseudomonas gingeri NCPPB 3146 = LMG 5327]|uniref:Uncharacterized protein n=2 Tax=Pseudomonas gingeri TaxID=117681 RepID=A0A7Y7XUG0_9PSED|nr:MULTISPECIES: hypothetical protein [Pseudomonas]NWC12304.1 hypothetical protein [Pseudomonas gingeri]NWE47653.1 hypothetical protein [Pseudomonas gingeri]NWE69827.1 hypothetical protein [Pseudomonas gingeri]PNQ92421.1 hypothetical protein CCU68_11435 [Pseudomonas gingeri NCPPB 3146 = LMG 5327]BBP78214.1 hypothetical protein PHLH7_43180 [Pseudomonas sp. Ost2]